MTKQLAGCRHLEIGLVIELRTQECQRGIILLDKDACCVPFVYGLL